MCWRSALLSLLVASAAASYAAEPAPLEQGFTDTIVITGTRRVSPLADSPVAVEVIRREDIEQSQARNAAEALDRSLGLIVTNSFRGDGLEIQGLSARHVLVLLDGERVTGKVGEQLDLSRFAAESIERIEVVKGAGSAIYGSDAIGGVINIITRKARRKPSASLDLLGGSDARAEITTNGAYREGDVGASFSFGFRRQDPYRLDDTSPATTASGFEDLSSMLRLDARLTDDLKVDARVQHLYREQTAIDATELPPDLEGNPRWRLIDRTEYLHTLQARLAPELRLAKGHTLELSVSGSASWSWLIEDQRNGTQYDRRQPTTETLFGGTLQYSGTLGDHMLTSGLELFNEYLASERLEGGDPTRLRFAAYVQDEWRLLDALVVLPGARVDYDSQFGVAVTPRLAVRYDPLPELTLRASYGFGFRAPGFRELYLVFENPSVGYRVEGNPDLAPERSRSLELSVDLHPTDRFTTTLSVFRHDLDNLIVSLPAVSRPGQLDLYGYANVATAVSQGFEARVVGAPHRRLKLDASYGFTDSRDGETHEKIAGRATHQLTAQVSWRPPFGLDLSVRGMVLGPRPFEVDLDRDGAFERVDSDWHALFDVRAAYDLTPNLRAFGGIDNVFGTGDPDIFPIRPRNFYLGLSGRY